MRRKVFMGGSWKFARAQSENLTRSTSGASEQDTTAGAFWDWFWKYTVPNGNAIGFKAARGDARYSLYMILYKAATTAMDDDHRLRIAVYEPDGDTLNQVLWTGTYGTIKNATKYDIQKMLAVNISRVVSEGYQIRLEAQDASDICDVSASSVDIGVIRYTT